MISIHRNEEYLDGHGKGDGYKWLLDIGIGRFQVIVGWCRW